MKRIPDLTSKNLIQKKVSVLISVKYHQEYLINCLKSFESVSIGIQNIEIIIGDDSEKHILSDFLKEFISKTSLNIKIISIYTKNVDCGPKGSVLQQLTNFANGDFYYFTDADCENSPLILEKFISCFDKEVGVTTAATSIKSNRLFDFYQNMDFLWNHFLNFLLGKIQRPISIMGTNYMVSKSCFEELGGFHNLEFPMVEDFSFLLKLKNQNKWDVKVLFSNDSSVVTNPQESWNSFKNQRLRWLQAFDGISFYDKSLMLLLLITDFVTLYYILHLTLYSVIGFIYWGITYLFLRFEFKKNIHFGHFLVYKLLNPFISLLLLGHKYLKQHKNTW